MINKKEYELLKEYREQGYKWIARDKNGKLYTFQEIPRRYRITWNFGGVAVNILKEEYFTFIKWQDEEPTKIDDLIRDYESHQIITSKSEKVVIPQFVADWIEEVKSLKRAFKLECLFGTTTMPADVHDWLDERYGDTDILARAWLDGYEIEKEQLYNVALINVELVKNDGRLFFHGDMKHNNKLTRQEIESVDPVLMQIAKVVE